MNSTATAYPASLIQTCLALRPGNARALVAGLGTKSLVDFFERSSVRNRFVAEHVSEGRPARIVDALCHAGFGKSFGIHVANCNVLKLPNDAGREFVVEVSPGVGYAGVKVGRVPLLSSPLSGRKLDFQGLKVARIVDLLAGRERGEILKAQVDADTGADRLQCSFCNLDGNVQKPIPPRITGEVAAVLDLPFRERTGVEYSVGVSGEPECIPMALDVAAFNGNPAKGFSASITQIRTLVLKPRCGVPVTNLINGSGKNAQFLAASGSQVSQVKTAEPFAIPPNRLSLPVVAIVPNEVDGSRLPVQFAGKRFHAVAVDQDHEAILLERRFNTSAILNRIKA